VFRTVIAALLLSAAALTGCAGGYSPECRRILIHPNTSANPLELGFCVENGDLATWYSDTDLFGRSAFCDNSPVFDLHDPEAVFCARRYPRPV
jgi:hypothetical protein